MNARQRANLLKLAVYLESLPRNYKHFDMLDYADHQGGCELPMPADEYAVKKPSEFLANCGTVACAAGHGPAAGIPLRSAEIAGDYYAPVQWGRYVERAFGAEDRIFDFLFDAGWAYHDNHHYGAAARIRYFLDTDKTYGPGDSAKDEYAPYRKGSRSAKRREIEQVSA